MLGYLGVQGKEAVFCPSSVVACYSFKVVVSGASVSVLFLSVVGCVLVACGVSCVGLGGCVGGLVSASMWYVGLVGVLRFVLVCWGLVVVVGFRVFWGVLLFIVLRCIGVGCFKASAVFGLLVASLLFLIFFSVEEWLLVVVVSLCGVCC